MLGIFAYRNPDPKESYYVPTSQEHMYGSLEEAEQVSQFDPVDMHGRFHTWLKWGFWNMITTLCFVLFSIATRPSGHGFTLKLYIGSICCCACGLVASIQLWKLFGLIYRFNKAGRVASGDLLVVPKDLDAEGYKEWRSEIDDQGY